MTNKNKITSFLKKRVLILDGATGTQLQKRGMPAGICPEQWCLQNPKTISAVHADYASAGSDIVYSCTFGANRLKLAQYNLTDVFEINRDLARLAKKAAGKHVLVAGDIGPTGYFVQPFGKISFEDAVNIFKEQIKGLIAGGADLLVIETMMDIQEARAALTAVRELTKIFVMVTMTFEDSGCTLNGTNPLAALVTLQSLGADAVGCNCSTGPQKMLEFIKKMRPYAAIPLIAKPNAGMPRLVNGVTVFDMNPAQFSGYAKDFVRQGVSFIGGCCGTTPEYIRSVKVKLKTTSPVYLNYQRTAIVSSNCRAITFNDNEGLRIIGERINPTGKKDLQNELRAGSFSLVRQIAKDQQSAGADLLDVNCGIPGLDEQALLTAAINILSASVNTPLVIDSSNPQAIEKALRIYPGRALINSISGEKHKLKKMLAIAKKYGAMFIILPITEKGVPKTFIERKKVIMEIFSQAQKYGFNRDDMIVDCLTMAISTDSLSARETLDTISWCRNKLGLRTVLGISNVSFGLPGRQWLNAAFLAFAVTKGLTAAIVNPASQELMNIVTACDTLCGYNAAALKYINRFNSISNKKEKKAEFFNQPFNAEDKVYSAIIEGNSAEIIRHIDAAIAEGAVIPRLVQDKMIPAITRVGELFDKKEYFLPQLIASAETMEKGFEYLIPKMEKTENAVNAKAVILLATVEGDIHDIGKNIVALLLKNHGFIVVDLGKNVSTGAIITAIKKHNPALVGLSALMTTTMISMKNVVEHARNEGLLCKFVIGGAAVTDEYARQLGVQYARDGVDAVRAAKQA